MGTTKACCSSVVSIAGVCYLQGSSYTEPISRQGVTVEVVKQVSRNSKDVKVVGLFAMHVSRYYVYT